jgi:hypothetical protein
MTRKGVLKMVRTIEESKELLNQKKNEIELDGELNINDILIEDGDRLLVRKISLMNLDGNFYYGIRHESWSNREKYEQDISTEFIDGQTYIYCSGYAGAAEDELIEIFNRRKW